MNRFIKIGVFSILATGLVAFSATPVPCEELYNLEILFRKSYNDWAPDSIVIFGHDVTSAGDINDDGYDDIAAAGWDYDPFLGWRAIVFVFFGGSPMDTVPDVILRDAFWGGSSSISLASGDVNGDGFSDVVVGLPYGPGNVDIYFGGNPMDTVVDLVLAHPPPLWYFGRAVATGDVNGDGYCDIMACDYYENDGEGAVWVYYGGPLLDDIPDVTLRGHGREGLGMTVGSGGDVNSDGCDDIVVGAWTNSEKYVWAGRIYVYYGGAPMDTTYDVGMHGEGSSHHLGWDEVSLGVNSYIYDFLVAGTRLWPNGFPSTGPGKVYVLFGDNPMDSVPDVCMHGQTDSTELGPTSAAGDVDGDGVDDVIGGAHAESGRTGAVYIWLGGVDMDTIPDAWMKGDSVSRELGWRVASAGDVDGDGNDEIVFSNYAAGIVQHTVWVCKYTGTGIDEGRISSSHAHPRYRITCTPNPFRKSTTIKLLTDVDLQGMEDREISLTIHDVAGRLVRRLDVESDTVVWDGKDTYSNDVRNGVYFLCVTSGQFSTTVKLVVIR